MKDLDLKTGHICFRSLLCTLFSQLDDPDCGTLDDRYFRTHSQVARSPAYINMREVCDHHSLPPGDYMVVPTTFDPNEEADFILRVFSEKKDDVKWVQSNIECRTANNSLWNCVKYSSVSKIIPYICFFWMPWCVKYAQILISSHSPQAAIGSEFYVLNIQDWQQIFK